MLECGSKMVPIIGVEFKKTEYTINFYIKIVYSKIKKRHKYQCMAK